MRKLYKSSLAAAILMSLGNFAVYAGDDGTPIMDNIKVKGELRPRYEMVDDDVYKITGELVLSVGNWDFTTGEFTETETKTLTLSYVGSVTPLE